MSGIDRIAQNYSLSQIAGMSAPSTSGWSKFGKVLGGMASALPVVGSAIGTLTGGSDMDANFSRQYQMIQLQNEIQIQSQIFNTMSNVSKSKHEAAMSAIRNMK